MAKFYAIFVHLDGLEQCEVGRALALEAEIRESAVTEAATLRRPAGANYLKITLDGQVTSWIALAVDYSSVRFYPNPAAAAGR